MDTDTERRVRRDPEYPKLLRAVRKRESLLSVAYARRIRQRTECGASEVYEFAHAQVRSEDEPEMLRRAMERAARNFPGAYMSPGEEEAFAAGWAAAVKAGATR